MNELSFIIFVKKRLLEKEIGIWEYLRECNMMGNHIISHIGRWYRETFGKDKLPWLGSEIDNLVSCMVCYVLYRGPFQSAAFSFKIIACHHLLQSLIFLFVRSPFCQFLHFRFLNLRR